MKTLLLVVGLLLIAGGVYAGYRGIDALDGPEGMRGQQMEVTRITSENKYRNRSAEEGDKLLAAPRQLVRQKQIESVVCFVGAGGALIAGFALVVVPSLRKRKAPAAKQLESLSPEVPAVDAGATAQNQEAPRL
jgi:hypothetical protein